MSETENELEFKGIIHSHPGGYDRPSSQDLTELKRGLNLNKHMPFYLVPIVTVSHYDTSQKHEVLVQDMKVSFYAGYRQEMRRTPFNLSGKSQLNIEEVHLKKMEIKVIPKGKFTNDLEILSSNITGVKKPQVYIIDHEDELMLAGSIEIPGLLDLIILVKHTYPICKPRMLVSYANGKQEEIKPNGEENGLFSCQLETLVQTVVENAKKNRIKEEKSLSLSSDDPSLSTSSIDKEVCRLKINTLEHKGGEIKKRIENEKKQDKEWQIKPMKVSSEKKEDISKQKSNALDAYNKAISSYQRNSFSTKRKGPLHSNKNTHNLKED